MNKLPTTKKRKTRIGVGLYALADVARVTQTNASTLRGWVGEGGLVARDLDPSENTLTFVELMEVLFIKMFRDEGVSVQTIRIAAATAAKRFNTAHPFSVKRFDTDGRTIFATLQEQSDNRELVEDLKRGQYVFDTILRPFFRKLDYHGFADVARYWPLEREGRVVLDPARKFGAPIDAETGVATKALYDAVTAGPGQDKVVVAEWFDVPVAAVEAAVTFERTLLA